MEKSRKKGKNRIRTDSDVLLEGITSPKQGILQPGSISPGASALLRETLERQESSASSGVSVNLSGLVRKKKKKGGKRRAKARSPEAAVQLGNLKEEEESEQQQVVKNGDESPSSSPTSASEEPESEVLDTRICRILREQLSTMDAVSLTEEEMAQNKQGQDDEILALEAIYETSFRPIVDAEDEQRIFMLSVTPEVADSVLVYIGSSPSESQKPAFSLQHLPPIHLAFTYSSGYPSHCPPAFLLHSEWLSTQQLVELREILETIASVQIGEVILYAWTDFIHSQYISEKIVLRRQSEAGFSSSNVLSDFVSPESAALFLLRHNEEMQETTFRTSLQLCDICFTEYAGKDFVRFPCQHFYCKVCMKQYASIHVSEGSVTKLNCPRTGCAGPVPPYVLKELLSVKDFERWEKLLLQKTLDAMIDVVYCPRCSTACIEDTDHFGQCDRCYFNFCSLCRQPRHAGQGCISPEARLRILQERSKGSFRGDDQARKEQDLVNQLLSMSVVARETVPCPACHMAISKTEGCNKMTCSNCGQLFCFRCREAIEGYQHFQHCVLFDQETIVAWEAEMQNLAHDQLDQGALYRCPFCRQANAKQGNNNHLFCWSCQNHYCALCGKGVRRAVEHYGPNKCRQHTAS